MRRLALWAGAALLTGSVMLSLWPHPDREDRAAPQLLMEAARNVGASFLGHQTSQVGREELQADVVRRGPLARYSYPSVPGHPARVVLERPEGVYVFWPSVQEGWRIHRRPAPDRPVACVQLCASNYRWKTALTESGTLELSAYRRSDHHLARKFWVDREHNLITRVESFDTGGQLASSWSLDKLKFSQDIPLSLFDPPSTTRAAVEMEHPQPAASLEQAAARVKFTPVMPNWLPDGYQLVEVWTETVQSLPSVRLVYSDGLETFSLLENQHADQAPLSNGVAHTRQLEIHKWTDGRLDYTLLGSDGNPAPRELARAFIEGGNSAPARGVLPIWQRGWTRLGSLF